MTAGPYIAIAKFMEEIRCAYHLLPHLGKKSALWFYFIPSPLYQHKEFGWVWGEERGGTKTSRVLGVQFSYDMFISIFSNSTTTSQFPWVNAAILRIKQWGNEHLKSNSFIWLLKSQTNFLFIITSLTCRKISKQNQYRDLSPTSLQIQPLGVY